MPGSFSSCFKSQFIKKIGRQLCEFFKSIYIHLPKVCDFSNQGKCQGWEVKWMFLKWIW